MLACARIGAVHAVVFAGFSAEALRDRINDAQAKVLITADGGFRRGQTHPPQARRRLRRQGDAVHPARRHRQARPFPAPRQGRPRPLVPPPDPGGRRPTASRTRATARTRSSSSTPPAPPASRRASSTPPAATWSAPTRRPSRSSTCGTTTSTGARRTSVGSRAIRTSSTARWRRGATCVMYEGAPDWPDRDRFWKIIEKHGVSILYTAPTAIRAFMKWGTEWPAKHDLSSLRLLGTRRRADQPGGVDVVLQEHRPGPLPDRGHLVADRDRHDHGQHAAGDGRDAAGQRPACPCPACASACSTAAKEEIKEGGGFLAHHASLAGDAARTSGATRSATGRPTGRNGTSQRTSPPTAPNAPQDGYLTLLGRVDDVLNVAGHRIGTMEVESALVDTPGCGRGRRRRRRRIRSRDRRSSRSSRSKEGSRPTQDGGRPEGTGRSRRSAPSPGRPRSSSAPICPRRAAARSCAACCATSARARSSATPRTLADAAVVERTQAPVRGEGGGLTWDRPQLPASASCSLTTTTALDRRALCACSGPRATRPPAADGEEGVRLAAQEPPDLILLDFMMPLKNSSTFADLQNIARLRNVPVAPAVMTAFGQNIGETHGVSEKPPSNIRGRLEKPFEMNVILERVAARWT